MVCVCVYIYIDRYRYRYNRILLSYRKNKIMSFATKWIQIEIVILSEISQIQKEKCCLYAQSKEGVK